MTYVTLQDLAPDSAKMKFFQIVKATSLLCGVFA